MSAPAPQSPLERAFDRLAQVLSTKAVALRWFDRYVATLGPRAVVDTAEGGTNRWVYRRSAGSSDVVPMATVKWTACQIGPRLLWGIEIADGRQHVALRYRDDGSIGDRSLNALVPGRLVELARVLREAKDPFEASVAFVAGLGDEQHGPGRVHYPVPAPGGVRGVWSMGLGGARRALYDGRISDTARFVVADGVEGRVVGAGVTREEALAAYAAEVARGLPQPRRGFESITDDYDDDGNLISRGELPPELSVDDESDAERADSHVVEPPDVDDDPDDTREAWRGDEHPGEHALKPEIDPVTGRMHFTTGPMMLRGPRPDAAPLPPRADCVPHVIIPLEPSPTTPLPRGRWVRLLGETGVTRHAVRIEERDGFLLVGADLLGLVDLTGLRIALDRIDAEEPEPEGMPEFEPFVRYRARSYRWAPATAQRPEGLTPAGGGRGPRFDAATLDGDALQAQVYRHRRVRRPVG